MDVLIVTWCSVQPENYFLAVSTLTLLAGRSCRVAFRRRSSCSPKELMAAVRLAQSDGWEEGSRASRSRATTAAS